MSNNNSEIRVDTRISTLTKVYNYNLGIFVIDKNKKEIFIVEISLSN